MTDNAALREALAAALVALGTDDPEPEPIDIEDVIDAEAAADLERIEAHGAADVERIAAEGEAAAVIIAAEAAAEVEVIEALDAAGAFTEPEAPELLDDLDELPDPIELAAEVLDDPIGDAIELLDEPELVDLADPLDDIAPAASHWYTKKRGGRVRLF